MYPEVVFQVAEERFDGLGILGDIRPVKELEHVRDRTLQIDIGLAYFVMCIGHLFRLGIHGFLSDDSPYSSCHLSSPLSQNILSLFVLILFICLIRRLSMMPADVLGCCVSQDRHSLSMCTRHLCLRVCG